MASAFVRLFLASLRHWWRKNSPSNAQSESRTKRITQLLSKIWEFTRDSFPDRRRQRYGDVEYDWEHRVNTTSGTTAWSERLLGLFHSPYQPTEPSLFQEMMGAVPVAFNGYTFIDIGSGKGRALLMASHYPFKTIIGVELIGELNRIAEENIRKYQSPNQRCREIQSIFANALDYEFPFEPTLLYLFNPLPEADFTVLLERLESSLAQYPRPIWVIYHNPLLERLLRSRSGFQRMGGTEQYAIYVNNYISDHISPHHS